MTNAVRVKNRDVLENLIETETMKRSTQEWLEILDGCGMPYAAINDIQGTLNHEHGMLTIPSIIASYNTDLITVLARGMVKEVDHPTCGPMKLVNTPVKYSVSKPGVRTPPPTLGQHTDEVLKDMLGMSEDDIASLRGEGVVT